MAISAHERFLIEKSEEAIGDGLQLERWCRGRLDKLDWFPLELGRAFRLPSRGEGFFDSVEINGQLRSVMGCRQVVEFGSLTDANAVELLRQFVLGEFLPRAHWTYEDGSTGGFTVEPSLYRTIEGEYGRFSPETSRNGIDWRTLGRRWAWVLLTVHIHDFVMDFGPFRKRLREAACVVAHPDFVHLVENPSPEYSLEVSIGYPFVDFAPIPNPFGFGPGKFGAAVKLYSFLLSPGGGIRVQMLFAAAPRCRKVFDFGRGWPDPVYGGAALLSRLTFGLWNSGSFHDRLDGKMLAQHCRVHFALIEGVETIWRSWVRGGCQ